MQAARENTQYLPGCHFPIKLHAGADLAAAVRDADDLLIATPSHVLRTTLEQLKPLLREGQGLIAACKGLEPKSGKLVHEVRSEEHTSELQSLMRISYAVFCLKKTKSTTNREQD